MIGKRVIITNVMCCYLLECGESKWGGIDRWSIFRAKKELHTKYIHNRYHNLFAARKYKPEISVKDLVVVLISSFSMRFILHHKKSFTETNWKEIFFSYRQVPIFVNHERTENSIDALSHFWRQLKRAINSVLLHHADCFLSFFPQPLNTFFLNGMSILAFSSEKH